MLCAQDGMVEGMGLFDHKVINREGAKCAKEKRENKKGRWLSRTKSVSKPPVSKTDVVIAGFDTPFAKNAQGYSTSELKNVTHSV